ncbi:uncharacterized protein LOC106457500 isoform X1 [Limulus polyphemus]|uniref:Uncharacterized protein LOC106457500 isoform X1 n=2 Tax=Limulus polyphemus TaxID=6850 RepID=A0ABM1S6C1_LIMPO|nr:uncharacterized protein LOC106457500 isoform X1 [Limulus polyphemus]
MGLEPPVIFVFRILPIDLQSIFFVCVLSLVPFKAMSAPLGSGERPRWVNPCGLPDHLLDPDSDLQNLPPFTAKELVSKVVEVTESAKNHAEAVEQEFRKEVFKDSAFNVDYMRQEWLPVIPPTSEDHFGGIDVKEAYKKAFEYLQYYAVGVDEMKMDQVLHPESGQFLDHFQEVENRIREVLCELQLGMYTLKIRQNPDVMKNVMSTEYRDIPEESKRNLRDYLILRDYLKSITYIWELFRHLLKIS